MDTAIFGLLLVVIVLLLGLTVLMLRRGKIEPKDIEPAVTKA